MAMPRLVIAGTTSGVGKTTVVAGILAALRGRGLRVQPFKCGPDYIDPSYHTLAAGLPSRNLDSWMLTREAMMELFVRASSRVDIAVVEGVMGLFDSRSGLEDSGSTAEIARWLDAPVVLIVDVSKMARSAAAMVLGYRQFDPGLRLAGVILNRVAGPLHLRWATEAVEEGAGVPVLGYLPDDSSIELPERHLGLVPAAESGDLPACIEGIRLQVEQTMDIDGLIRLAGETAGVPGPPPGSLFPDTAVPERAVIGVARDEAFNFYYEDNLDLLAAWGARLVPVSPVHDTSLPPDIAGMYIGGGFPEVFARELAGNCLFKADIAKAAANGMPIYAECGGLMYISEGIIDGSGERHEMAGLIPCWSVMQRRLVQMGYVVAEAIQDSIIATRGQRLRGHEFHWSTLTSSSGEPAYRKIEPEEQLEGAVAGPRGNVLGSYLHLHFGSEPSLARRFVDSCAAYDRKD